jgi:hypothetical protein
MDQKRHERRQKKNQQLQQQQEQQQLKMMMMAPPRWGITPRSLPPASLARQVWWVLLPCRCSFSSTFLLKTLPNSPGWAVASPTGSKTDLRLVGD